MSISVKELIDRVRNEITMDTDPDAFRWSDEVMVEFVVSCCRELFSIKKHLLLNDYGAPTSSSEKLQGVTLENLGTATLELPKRYIEAIMSGVAMRCFLMDSADQNNAARATYERSRFYELAGVSSGAGASAS